MSDIRLSPEVSKFLTDITHPRFWLSTTEEDCRELDERLWLIERELQALYQRVQKGRAALTGRYQVLVMKVGEDEND